MEITTKTIETSERSAFDAEFAAVIADLMNGVRNQAKMEEAAKEMDEGREEIRSRLGTLDLAVALIREGRDE